MVNYSSLLIGLLVYCMGANAVPRSEFFQYGSSAGDQTLGKYDGTTQVFHASVPIQFYSKSYTGLQVNGNGYLSLGNANDHAYARNKISPFYCDLDSGKGGNIYARVSTTDATAINKVKNLVANHFSGFPNFVAKEVVVATWDGVAGYCCKNYLLDTFQVVVASDGSNSFAIFLYLDGGINWPDATSTSSKAVAGFQDGGGQSTLIEGSSTAAILNIDQKSNVGIAGLFIFKINGATIDSKPSSESAGPGAGGACNSYDEVVVRFPACSGQANDNEFHIGESTVINAHTLVSSCALKSTWYRFGKCDCSVEEEADYYTMNACSISSMKCI